MICSRLTSAVIILVPLAFSFTDSGLEYVVPMFTKRKTTVIVVNGYPKYVELMEMREEDKQRTRKVLGAHAEKAHDVGSHSSMSFDWLQVAQHYLQLARVISMGFGDLRNCSRLAFAHDDSDSLISDNA